MLTPYDHKKNVLSALLNKTFPSSTSAVRFGVAIILFLLKFVKMRFIFCLKYLSEFPKIPSK